MHFINMITFILPNPQSSKARFADPMNLSKLNLIRKTERSSRFLRGGLNWLRLTAAFHQISHSKFEQIHLFQMTTILSCVDESLHCGKHPNELQILLFYLICEFADLFHTMRFSLGLFLHKLALGYS